MRLPMATAEISFHLRVAGLAEAVGSRSRLADPVGSRSIEDRTGAGTRSPCVAEAVEVP
jgi:hypothetical protein